MYFHLEVSEGELCNTGVKMLKPGLWCSRPDEVTRAPVAIELFAGHKIMI